MITWADCIALDASLSAVPEAAQDAILADVYGTLSADRWGDKLDRAAKYLAMHTGTLLLRGGGLGGVGPVQSESLGDAARSYAVGSLSASTDDLDATPWGLAYKRLRRGLLWAIVV